VQAHFSFGKHGLNVTLPDGPDYELLESRSAPPIAEIDSALAQALDRPIGCAPLAELARGKRTAAICVCDITRPAPNSITLPPLLARLHAAGIPPDGITILIATGLHRAATEIEIRTIVGAEIASRYRVVNHDARDLTAHRHLGSTARGTPVYIDRHFLDADLHITLGFIEQHIMLGFSGGRKLVAPGVAAQETIKVIHSPRFMREPLATEGSIDSNPLHGELLEIARMARHDFILDVTLTRDRAISGVFAGEPVRAHAAGVDFMRRSSTTPIEAPFDAVITSSAGHPLDLTFYQTAKGITAAQHIVKPGGRILLLGECAEGIGSPEYMRILRDFRGHAHYLDSIAGEPVIPDQWQLEKVALVGLDRELFFFTPGVCGADLGAFAPRVYIELDAALTAFLSGLASNARIALVPEGPYTFARVEESALAAR
jgi:lactate racemase